ncbi:hypothetical protein NGA_0689600, partial [Nannochloropsis gaditana CCMP526]|uniref:uncharacterized protein n=1 Tax=Nannochloropsis gaditana (strain CCMP526) TaxID=1093141 RepID=UPI00029F6BA6
AALSLIFLDEVETLCPPSASDSGAEPECIRPSPSPPSLPPTLPSRSLASPPSSGAAWTPSLPPSWSWAPPTDLMRCIPPCDGRGALTWRWGEREGDRVEGYPGMVWIHKERNIQGKKEERRLLVAPPTVDERLAVLLALLPPSLSACPSFSLGNVA